MSEQESPTDLQRLGQLFQRASTALGAAPSGRQLEEWSILVHTSMSGGERDYHGVQHVFDVADGMGPVETLAALRAIPNTFNPTVTCRNDMSPCSRMSSSGAATNSNYAATNRNRIGIGRCWKGCSASPPERD